MEDSRYQGLENRKVYVRSQVQSQASVAGAKIVKGTVGKNEGGRSRLCWILKVMLEDFVFIPVTRSTKGLKGGRDGCDRQKCDFFFLSLKLSLSLRLEGVIGRMMTLSRCPGPNPRTCKYVRSHGGRPQAKESLCPLDLEARIGKEVDSPLEPSERKASVPTP